MIDDDTFNRRQKRLEALIFDILPKASAIIWFIGLTQWVTLSWQWWGDTTVVIPILMSILSAVCVFTLWFTKFRNFL